MSKLDGDPKNTKNKLIWIPKSNNNINVTIIYFDNNNNGITKFIGEPSMRDILENDYVQLMKMNYFKCKSKNDNEIVLISIP